MSLATDLWDANQSLTQACLHNGFVQGIADGSLPKAKFAYYVGQDAFFLDAFARAYSVCAAKAPTAEAFGLFHGLAGGVLEELKLHGSYAHQWGVDLERVTPGVTTRRYVDFLTATAWSQPLAVTAAAMAPCMRLYAFLGQALAVQSGLAQSGLAQSGPAQSARPDHAYGDWIRTYNEPFFEALAQQLETLLDNYARTLDSPGHDAMRTAYRYAMQCELDFFQAAWEVEA